MEHVHLSAPNPTYAAAVVPI
ncbi:uncharacterized protein G2W53_025231 [Senna tora]|uniref:Uncharacterized protein n=1 Tax=Senna tora TaxID=362788 RepID=A0A834TEH3_9FABA|nr:uncharacterized protein G2W53_025231 [Senna tora]